MDLHMPQLDFDSSLQIFQPEKRQMLTRFNEIAILPSKKQLRWLRTIEIQKATDRDISTTINNSEIEEESVKKNLNKRNTTEY